MGNIEEKKKVGRPKGTKNKPGVKTGRPKGSNSKTFEEIRKNSFSVKISDKENEKVKKLRTKKEFKELNNRAFFMKIIELIEKSLNDE